VVAVEGAQSYPKAERTTACRLREKSDWRCQAIVIHSLEMRMIKALMAVAVAGVFALPALAQPSATGDKRVLAEAGGGGARGAASTAGATSNAAFDRLDRNHDGFVSRDEAKDAMELNTRFSELDRNNDGKLSRDEYGALHSSARGSSGKGAASASSGAGK
jgi:hypothetical protein